MTPIYISISKEEYDQLVLIKKQYQDHSPLYISERDQLRPVYVKTSMPEVHQDLINQLVKIGNDCFNYEREIRDLKRKITERELYYKKEGLMGFIERKIAGK